MANPEHVAKLQEGVDTWNQWRCHHPDNIQIDVSDANLCGVDLIGADLGGADLRGADLRGADLREADLREADLDGANLDGANLSEANLSRAELRWADLRRAELRWAALRWADLRGADLSGPKLLWVKLRASFAESESAAYLPPTPGNLSDSTSIGVEIRGRTLALRRMVGILRPTVSSARVLIDHLLVNVLRRSSRLERPSRGGEKRSAM